MNELFTNIMAGVMCVVVAAIGGWGIWNEHRAPKNKDADKANDKKDKEK